MYANPRASHTPQHPSHRSMLASSPAFITTVWLIVLRSVHKQGPNIAARFVRSRAMHPADSSDQRDKPIRLKRVQNKHYDIHEAVLNNRDEHVITHTLHMPLLMNFGADEQHSAVAVERLAAGKRGELQKMASQVRPGIHTQRGRLTL